MAELGDDAKAGEAETLTDVFSALQPLVEEFEEVREPPAIRSAASPPATVLRSTLGEAGLSARTQAPRRLTRRPTCLT